MSFPVPSLSPSSRRRRPLHERTPSQSNERPPASTLRLVMDKDPEEEVDIYSADPYPTKPEHILLPSGDNLFAGPLTSNPVSSSLQDQPTIASPVSTESASRNFLEDHRGSVSELSTLVQEGNLSSFIWGESPNSSKTSIPHLASPTIDEGHEAGDEKSESSDGTPLPPLSPTIKTVLQGSFTPERSDSDSTNETSPNIVQLGLTSSPNIVPLDSSSPNFMPIAPSSPYYVRESSSESSLYSANTFGTARRYVHPRHNNPSFLDRDRSQSPSFPSSPPSAALRSDRSTPSPALSPRGSTLSPSASPRSGHPRHQNPSFLDRDHSQSPTFPSSPPSAALRSDRSTPSPALSPRGSTLSPSASPPNGHTPSEIQAIIDSGIPVKYPTIRSPSYTGSFVEGSPSVLASQSSQLSRYQSSRNLHHLSVVPSEWSAERELSDSRASSHVDQTHSILGISKDNAKSGRPSDFSIRFVAPSESEEGADTLSQLPYPLRTKRSGSLSNRSMVSRLDSFRLMSRPGSSASAVVHTFPAWAKVYYRSGGTGFQFSALSLVEGSRPPTAASGPHAAHLGPLDISRSQTRPRKNTGTRLTLPGFNTADPRTHWAGGYQQETENTPRTPPQQNIPTNWSPHLYPDHRTGTLRRSLWNPPSLDEAAEGLISWRNVQVYLFCLGFLFPLAWFAASFLPLPPKVFVETDEPTTDQPDVERTFNNRVRHIDRIRFENARWWRRLNRCMTPVGLRYPFWESKG
ncbi:hypothetical protein PRK78_007424 [Emydomyces testavorans]|uniref:Serine-rich protein n=1 Tax=Emydomyces testavorans TaxID=2070801 RepID=A0AAF0DP82_9EURO|nr:hypothetical protein PRK78_007424 [Emydomyces testavorans]